MMWGDPREGAGWGAGWLAGLLLCLPVGLTGEGADAGGTAGPAARRESSYSATTLLLSNARVPESVALAEYYAAARGIPLKNLLRLDVEPVEEISRSQYDTQIARPLREMLLRLGWWMPERDESTGQQALRSQFHFLVLFHGMPLKIRAARGGEQTLDSTAASVDSELAALGHPGSALEGPLQNPYFESELPFAQAGLSIQLVGRIDGPSAKSCRNMIDCALRIESEGLWGSAYIDLTRDESPGNGWLREVANQLRVLGVPVTVNPYAQVFPKGYPMKDPAFYFGGRQKEVAGPFADPGFQFRPGAIAAHLTEVSAGSVRDGKKAWAAALLGCGAAAVVGNVADPHLPLSHRLDILVDRLIKGHTLIESAFMASETLSWMGVVVGDPLYRPFPAAAEGIDERHYQKDGMLPYKVIRLAHGRWGHGQPVPDEELIMKLEMASAKLPHPELIEHLGLLAVEMGNYREARTHFLRARSQYPQVEDQVRMDFHLADLAWLQDEKLNAMKIWRDAARDFPDIPAGQAAAEFMKGFQNAKP